MKKKIKQIIAIICIAILLLLYVSLLIFAIFDFPGREQLFNGCLLATIAVPIMAWIFMFLYERMNP